MNQISPSPEGCRCEHGTIAQRPTQHNHKDGGIPPCRRQLRQRTRQVAHHIILTIALLAAVSIAVSGCRSNRDRKQVDAASIHSTAEDLDALPGGEVIACGWEKSEHLQSVYFDYDSAGLTTPTVMTLQENARRMLDAPNTIVQIAGHCDERGTQEYNMALGEKRAQSVRNHLRQLGVPGDRLVTISFGEEAPAAPGNSELAWSRNRRCEFMSVRAN